MTGFLAVGQKLADRWAALIAVPGLLYLAAVTAAVVLGQEHALSYLDLSRKIAAWAASPALKSAGGTALIIAAVFAGSVAAGLVAAAGGRLAETVWTLPGDRPPAKWLADWRRDRSAKLKAIADTSVDPAAVGRAIARADRICLVEPACPTWIGDRLRACRVRVEVVYGLDLAAAWPRLWLTVPDTVRTELGTARDAFSAAARLTAWAALYLVLGIWWWPAVLVAVVTGITGATKGRTATGNLADLIESVVDLHSAELAAQLGQQANGPVTPAIGRRLTRRMRKDRWDPNSPVAQIEGTEKPAGVEELGKVISDTRPRFFEHVITHAEGQLWRLEVGDNEFLLIDALDGVPTLNWTATISPRECVRLFAEQLGLNGEAGAGNANMILSLHGEVDQINARFGTQIAATASSAFDEECEFLRFDDRQTAMALQILPSNDGKPIKVFGVSSSGLDRDTLASLMRRTGTRWIGAYALDGSNSILVARIAELAGLSPPDRRTV
jgi:hypothetical protein